MKHQKHMPTLILIIISGILFNMAAFMNRESLYANYALDIKKEPLLTIFMQGLSDRIFPWDGDFSFDNLLNSTLSSAEIETSPTLPDTSSENTVTVSSTAFVTQAPENAATYSFTNVDISYFDDALFIGDSRTVGLHDYSDLSNAVFYAKVSSTIYEIMDDPMISVNSAEYPYYGSSTISVRTALCNRQFGKIYLMVGINELGTGTAQTYFEQYEDVIEDIRKLQPNALIFVEAIMHVTTEKSNNDPIYNNKGIDERNEKLKTLANQHDIFYIDLNEALDDETGGLNADYTFDSVHLKASKYTLWEDFLLSHGIMSSDCN